MKIHSKNSPVTQTTPEPMLLIWGGWPLEKNPPLHLAKLANPVILCLSGHSDTLFSKPLMSPFDTQVYHESQICLRFHQILKVILEMAFSAHWTWIWKLNCISMTIINKVARKCIWCCHRVQRCMTAPYCGIKLCSGAWKRGQDSHVGMFSLCLSIPNCWYLGMDK